LKHYERTGDLIETQVLSPMRVRGDLSTYNLNNKIQSIINPVSESDIYIEVKVDRDKVYKIKLGDKVINTKNNYKAVNIYGEITPIFNGNMGIVKEIDNGTCVVDFVGIGEIVLDRKGVKKLELSYACTIHKSQGSGFHTAIVAIESSAYVLLNAEMLYTGITRAKKYCVLVGQNSAIRTAINKREIKRKQTYLGNFLQQEIELE
jgi:exodeoxyribonuclease V alpha subunit